MVAPELDLESFSFMEIIYYTGVGDYRQDHCYSPREFIVLMNENSDQFDQTVYGPMPVLNQNDYSHEELGQLLEWSGATLL